MVPIGKFYYYHEGKVYREVQPEKDRWKLTTKSGKRKWITKKQIESLIDNTTK